MDAKYIVIRTGTNELLFTFPSRISHSAMFAMVKHLRHGIKSSWVTPYGKSEAVAAGYIGKAGNCYGESESLKLKARPEIDTALFKNEHVRSTVEKKPAQPALVE